MPSSSILPLIFQNFETLFKSGVPNPGAPQGFKNKIKTY